MEREHPAVRIQLCGVTQEDLCHEGHFVAINAFRASKSPWPPRHTADLGDGHLARIPRLQDHPASLQRLPLELDDPFGLWHLE
jgi:hypothetical protein